MRRHTSDHDVSEPLLNSVPTHQDPDIWQCIRLVLVNFHTEAVSAWTHLVAAALFTIYGIFRSVVYDTKSTVGLMASISVFLYAVTFFISTSYHVCVPNRHLSKIMRELDYAFVLASFSLTIATDTTFALHAGPGLHAQTLLDIGASTTVAVLFFLVLSPSQNAQTTWIVHGFAVKGTQRRYHSDADFAKTRQGVVLCVMLGWIMTMQLVWQAVPPPASTLLIVAYVFGAVLLTATQINDLLQFTDQFLPDISNAAGWCRRVDSHSIWHIISVIATAFLVAAREHAIHNLVNPV